MASLQEAYGTTVQAAATLQQQQQQAADKGVRKLPVQLFGQQAEFVGLAAAALAAVQVGTNSSSPA